jgi:outer membrane protein
MKTFIFLLLAFFSLRVPAQEMLREYIKQGLENNLALKQKEAGFRKSLEALKEAHGLFYPAVSLNARYSVSEGGRVIGFPIGDLLNPVYTTLNQLTASNAFPQVENQEFRFLRPTEYDTKLRLVQPVFNTGLIYNAKIRKELVVAEEISVEQYRRELVAEIKKAYFAVGMAGSILMMLEQTQDLLRENVRVNEKLVENNKVTVDNLYRSQTELNRLDQKLVIAKKNRSTAEAYFNFLLNKPLDDSILIDLPVDYPRVLENQDTYLQEAGINREELKSLMQYGAISTLNIKRNRSSGLPDLMVVADYGFQGEKVQFNKNQDYLQASVVLSWNLFQGFQNRSKIREAMIQKEMIDQQLEEAKSRIALQVSEAFNELKASEAGLGAAESQIKSAREGFRLVNRKYGSGQASLIEFVDARVSMTQAEENLIISRYTYLSDLAEFEKVTAPDNPEK